MKRPEAPKKVSISHKTEWTGFLDNTTNKAEKSVILQKNNTLKLMAAL